MKQAPLPETGQPTILSEQQRWSKHLTQVSPLKRGCVRQNDEMRRCVDGLLETLTQIYNDQETSSVLQLTQKVAAVFAKGNRFADTAELEELKQLKADAQASKADICVFKHRHARALFPNCLSHTCSAHAPTRSGSIVHLKLGEAFMPPSSFHL